MSNENILFQDIFDIRDMDPQGKRFDRVSRLVARSENYEMDLTLDFNVEIYPLKVGEKFSLVLASSLSLEPKATTTEGVEKKESWRERAPGERDLSDEYEYVMFGKVYRYEDSNKGAAAGQQV
ncbi:RNA polymerase [Cokeromyces recurvatus]|uniref:RNA polymerase n=1 Tax=Cokeromyces recurvatus TaxID=90255 RepID=UPI0022210D0A|nr:RNA polymerase [Cokeromyces recurvatus]KAI7905298.1 RNA polymerase [Cokeromyces recurvatus]